MKPTLPEFEGEIPKQSRLRLTGHSDAHVGCLAKEEEVFLIVKGVVSNIDHGSVGNVFSRTHKVKATELFLMDRDLGERVLSEAAMWADEQFGVPNLFNQEDGGNGSDPS